MRRADVEDLALLVGAAAVAAGVVWWAWPSEEGATSLGYAPAPEGGVSAGFPAGIESRIEAPAWADVVLAPGVKVTVAQDYLRADGIRVPLTPAAAQRAADRFNAILPTPTLVTAIWRAAPIKVAPRPMTPHGAATRDSWALAQEHDAIVNQQIAGRQGLVAGHFKDIVSGPAIGRNPGKVIIFGWHRLDGTPIQSASAVHGSFYRDYSHGTRLVSRTAHVNGVAVPIETIFADPTLSRLVSSEGPLRPDQLRYPTP